VRFSEQVQPIKVMENMVSVLLGCGTMAHGTWFQYFVIYWSQLQEFFSDILNMWTLHLPDMLGTNYQSCVTTSGEKIQHYIATKAKNRKRLSASIHTVPWIILEHDVLNVTTPKTTW
jgi:hypothetical protein